MSNPDEIYQPKGSKTTQPRIDNFTGVEIWSCSKSIEQDNLVEWIYSDSYDRDAPFWKIDTVTRFEPAVANKADRVYASIYRLLNTDDDVKNRWVWAVKKIRGVVTKESFGMTRFGMKIRWDSATNSTLMIQTMNDQFFSKKDYEKDISYYEPETQD